MRKGISVTINSIAISATATATVTITGAELSVTTASVRFMTSRQVHASILGVLDLRARLAPDHSFFSIASGAIRRRRSA